MEHKPTSAPPAGRTKEPRAISRKMFLTGAGALLASAAIPPRFSAQARAAASNDNGSASVREVADGIFVHRGHHSDFSEEYGGDVSNSSFIIGRDSVAVIDTGGNLGLGSALLAAIREKTDRPVRYVLNTHMHPDHVLGNAAFKADRIDFVAHHKMKRGLMARSKRYMSMGKLLQGDKAFAGTEIVLPTMPIADQQTVDLGDRVLTLTANPTAHTDNDLMIKDTRSDTLFLGDLLFAEHVPTLDGSIVGWIALIEKIRQMPASRVVPGHGPESMDWPSAIAPLYRYLTTVAAEVRQMIAEDKSIKAATKVVARSERESWELFDGYHGRNVSAAYAELEWE